MIDIDKAIEQSKNKENISNGGSACFDFGDVVLVKYTCELKYLKNGEHAREKSEEIMEAINKKNDEGVNTPRHIAIRRVVEGKNDVCYILQQKCPGYNCEEKCTYTDSFDKRCSDLKSVLDIPFEHYKKLVSDGCKLYEMGYEPKPKNLFYDDKTGFWYIDFLCNDKNNVFDSNDIEKVFHALRYRIPYPSLASKMNYNIKLTEDQTKKENELLYAIEAKTFLAKKAVVPNLEKYEKFYLFNYPNDLKKYFMEQNIVNKDLFNLEPIDYEIYDELKELIIKPIINSIVNGNNTFGNVESNGMFNSIRDLNLKHFFQNSKYNTLKKEDFDDKYDFEYESEKLHKQTLLKEITNRLQSCEKNENVVKFLNDAENYFEALKNIPNSSFGFR